MKQTRRTFLAAAGLGLVATQTAIGKSIARVEPIVQTVLRPIPASRLGFTLAHEHVMCDFIGAAETGRHRWTVQTVVDRMRPFLLQLKERRVTGFVDCTPAYIGRDPRVLEQLAIETGIHIITNTGYYGGANDKYVPKHAYSESAETLASRWLKEWEEGIEGTAVKPGFMKIGVDEIKGEELSAIDEKLVRAAARVSSKSGLAAVCHTGGSAAGLAATRIFMEEGGNAGRFIVAHADGHGLEANKKVAELGAWVSFDGVSRRPIEEHLLLVKGLVERHSGQILLSHDNGWYSVGEKNGGEVRDYNFLPDKFIPALKKDGISEEVINKLTVENPARAFSIG